MNPWTQVLGQIWYFLENGPKSGPVTEAFPPGNRYRYGPDELEADPPSNSREPVLIVDQTGGKINLEYSTQYIEVTEEYQITIWSASLALNQINDLRLSVLSAIDSGLPDLGLANVQKVEAKMGRVTAALDKIERDADGRLMQWRHELQRSRKRAVLLELLVTFLIDRNQL
jgi:hypothetical protein